MPAKRIRSDSGDSPTSGPTAPKRNVSHISRACDGCRKRKMRCDGKYPQCSVCLDRGADCHYNDEDKRKTNMEQLDEMRSRMDRFEKLLENLIVIQTSQNPAIAAQLAPTVSGGTSSTIVEPAPSSVQLWTNESQDSTVTIPATSQYREPVLPAPVAPQTLPSNKRRPSRNLASSPLANLEEGNAYDQFQRVDEAAGALIQYGPTSIWTCRSPEVANVAPPPRPALLPGDWVDWSRNLPSSFRIDRVVHDRALQYFAAFYAPWCLSVDMDGFMSDLELCNVIRAPGNGSTPPTRTAHYSPLLHCCVLFLGLYMIRDENPDTMANLESAFVQHCTQLLLVECRHTGLSSLSAYNLFANCMHFLRTTNSGGELGSGDRQSGIGYLFSGLAIAGVHALGLNVNCESYVQAGQITNKERALRESAFWSAYAQDTIRSLAGGRQPMLPDFSHVPLPQIDPAVDSKPWSAPMFLLTMNPMTTFNGGASMRSTAFHWMASLAVLNRKVLETLYSPHRKGSRSKEAVADLSRQQDEWYSGFPFQPPEATPLPHVLLLHMFYHLSVIFVHRSFYRSGVPTSTNKCDQASNSILHLLRLFDNTHGIRYAHHNLINVIFGGATIFLLRGVGASNDVGTRPDIQNFRECVELMRRLGSTWHEAVTGREILLSLQNEYLPDTEAALDVDNLNELHSWLESQDFCGMVLPDQTFSWDDFGSFQM